MTHHWLTKTDIIVYCFTVGADLEVLVINRPGVAGAVAGANTIGPITLVLASKKG